jgi:hypothetical protein
MHESINTDQAIEFSIHDHDEICAAAAFIAQLVREDVTYTLHRDSAYIRVTITGGF